MSYAEKGTERELRCGRDNAVSMNVDIFVMQQQFDRAVWPQMPNTSPAGHKVSLRLHFWII